MNGTKTACPISRGQFAAKAAENVVVKVGEAGVLNAGKKEFSTGSLGWHGAQKVTLVIDGVKVPCQVNVQITAIGSKELPV